MSDNAGEYYKGAAKLLERLRDEIGAGFGENDWDTIGDIVVARLKAWDRLDREKIEAEYFRQQLQMIADIGDRPETSIHDQQVKKYSDEAIRIAKKALLEE